MKQNSLVRNVPIDPNVISSIRVGDALTIKKIGKHAYATLAQKGDVVIGFIQDNSVRYDSVTITIKNEVPLTPKTPIKAGSFIMIDSDGRASESDGKVINAVTFYDLEVGNTVMCIGVDVSSNGGGGGGTTDYNALNNRPMINGVLLEGDKDSVELQLSFILPNDINMLSDASTDKEIRDAVNGLKGFNDIINAMSNGSRVYFDIDGEVVACDYRVDTTAFILYYNSFGSPDSLGNTTNITVQYDDVADTFRVGKVILRPLNSFVMADKALPYFKDNDWNNIRGNNAGEVLTINDDGDPEFRQLTDVYTKPEVETIAKNTLEASKAYTNSLVTEYAAINLYSNSETDLSTDKPVGARITKRVTLNKNIEKAIASLSYTLPNDGISLKDNLYELLVGFLPFAITDNNRIYIRTLYSIKGAKVFDVVSILGENGLIQRQVLSELTNDLTYKTGDVVKLDIFGYTSKNNQDLDIVFNDIDIVTGITRNEPISTLDANLIKTTINGAVMTQQQFNDSIPTVIDTHELLDPSLFDVIDEPIFKYNQNTNKASIEISLRTKFDVPANTLIVYPIYALDKPQERGTDVNEAIDDETSIIILGTIYGNELYFNNLNYYSFSITGYPAGKEFKVSIEYDVAKAIYEGDNIIQSTQQAGISTKHIWVGSKADYDGINPKEFDTLYFILE